MIGVVAVDTPRVRWLAADMAVSLAADAARGSEVCVVDANPRVLDVTRRLGYHSAVVEEFLRPCGPDLHLLQRRHDSAPAVLASGGRDLPEATDRALAAASEAFDIVVVDFPLSVLADSERFPLRRLDWLVLGLA